MSDNIMVDECAACGNAGDGISLVTCTACLLVKYCGPSCQEAHRSKHEGECKTRAAELHEEALFAKPPPPDECPICMLPLPLEGCHQRYNACCGKIICMGCIFAEATMKISEGHEDDDLYGPCPFCRTPEQASDEELVERIKKRADADDADAICQLGYLYDKGSQGFPQDYDKAMELWLRACELGDDNAYFHVARAYHQGRGVEMDRMKAKHYLEIAATKGHCMARHILGLIEYESGNHMRAAKHWIIAAESGFDHSLKEIRECFLKGIVSKEDYAKALRAHKKSKDELSSEGRTGYSAYKNRVGAGEG